MLFLAGIGIPDNCSAGNINFVDVNSPNAFDTNAYPSTESRPWKTIQHAADTLKPGDMVYIKAGTNFGTVIVTNSGVGTNYITYRAYPGQEQQAIIDHGQFIIKQASCIEVSGLRVQYATNEAILVNGPCANIGIYNNYTFNSESSGIAVWGVPWESDPAVYNWKAITNVVVAGNTIDKACNGGYNECLDIANGVGNFWVSYNLLKNGTNAIHGGEGIDCKEGVSDGVVSGNEVYGLLRTAIYLDAGAAVTNYYQSGGLSTNIQVFANRVHDNGLTNGVTAIGVTSEGRGNIDGIYIYNNLVYKNSSAGINIYHYKQGTTNSPVNFARNIYVVNNTVFGNALINTNLGGIWVADANASNLFVENNLSVSNLNQQIYAIAGVTLTSNFTANANFINASNGDFHLASTSRAIDAGSSNAAPVFDYDGAMRPAGAAVDCGAFEYNLSPTYQVEGLDFASGGAATTADIIPDPLFIGGEGVELYATNSTADIIFPIYVPTNGISYTVRLGIKKLPSLGTFQFAAAPFPGLTNSYVNHGNPISEYSPSTNYTTVDITNVVFSSIGYKDFKFTVTGKDPGSLGYNLMFDDIQLIAP